ncbi:phosphoglycolate phosphatase [Sulfurifustis variabilis]|nr:phosphoglycolate phosphatase [Sulfurifustis variabilis]
MPAAAGARFPLAVKMIMIDLDGTLVDTAPDIADSANLMLADLGREPHPLDRIAEWIGNGVSRLVKRALTGEMWAEPDAPLFEQAIARFRHHYGERVAAKSRPFPGVVDGLEELARARFRLACITNKAGAFTRPLLDALDLSRYFELVLSGDSLPKKKPDPLPLLHACEHFGIRPEQGLLVGDSGNDVKAARAAGMHVVCVSYGYNHGQDVRELNPDAVIESLGDLPRLVTLVL